MEHSKKMACAILIAERHASYFRNKADSPQPVLDYHFEFSPQNGCNAARLLFHFYTYTLVVSISRTRFERLSKTDHNRQS